MRSGIILMLILWSAFSFAQCECRYNYEQNLLPTQTVASVDACRALIGADLSQRYLDHEICTSGESVEVGWSCGSRVSEARAHRCADIGMGIIREQVGEIFPSTAAMGPELDCDQEEYRLRPLVSPETLDESREQFRIKPWKRGVKVRYRLEF